LIVPPAITMSRKFRKESAALTFLNNFCCRQHCTMIIRINSARFQLLQIYFREKWCRLSFPLNFFLEEAGTVLSSPKAQNLGKKVPRVRVHRFLCILNCGNRRPASTIYSERSRGTDDTWIFSPLLYTCFPHNT